jgi:hypothetical protein
MTLRHARGSWFSRASATPISGDNGDKTNQSNPNMRPSVRISGTGAEFINIDFDGGNDKPASPRNPLNQRSTCIGYSQNPVNSVLAHNWIHASNIKTSGNVIVPDSSLEPSGDPRNGNFRINTTGTCLAKYGGTMLN